MASKHHYLIGSPNHDAPKTVVITGAARGGTSMVAGTVRELGINLGARLGENHEDPQFLPKDLDHIRSIVAKRNEDLDTWGWKMPHSLAYLDEIEADLRNPHIILVWRNVLATALSQVNRSGATIDNALAYSQARLQEMIEQLAKFKSPVLLVNYEQAVRDPEEFVNTLAEYLDVQVTADMKKNCLRFIDPKKGYQQVSETFFEVTEIEGPFVDTVEHIIVPRGLEQVDDTPFYRHVKPNPRFILRTGKPKPLPDDVVVTLENTTNDVSDIKFLLDFDWQFSQNLAFKAKVAPGVHSFRVQSNGKLKRIAVVPSITDDQSDLINVQLLACDQQ
ncbi:MAG: sulfotransferase [Alphaproteobacteria bacterium]|nr:sulfotransferase [Alphaproteobacteria bacterium]